MEFFGGQRTLQGSWLQIGSRLPALLILMFAMQISAHEFRSGSPGEEQADIVKLVRELGPSVVAVHVTLGNVRIFPGAKPSEHRGGGSGFVVDRHGRVVTNFHVVAAALEVEHGSLELRPDAAITISFTDQPEREFPVRVRGATADYDLALLEFVNADDRPNVEPLRLGDSNLVEPGQQAIVIGSPFGLQSTVTAGIISAIEREQPGLVGLEIPFIQSDAATNPGNSGGPLFNAKGEVIGISNAILASAHGPGAFVGVGFAVPVNLLKDNMDKLVAGGLFGVAAAAAEIIERPRLGLSAALSMEEYPTQLRQALGMPEHGVVVGEVSPRGPADEAGLIGATDTLVAGGQAFPIGGDIITAAAGRPIKRTIHLQEVILNHDVNDGAVTLKIWRDGEEREVDVTLEVVPASVKQ
ncbi:MAG: trypsin-like peptidase domain-containing protein [Cellvibrionaceae bacterium]